MAWNEPGGNGKDPWGNNDQGPPDLDEIFKGLKEKWGGSGSGGGLPGGFGAMVGVLALVLIGAWIWNSVYRVDEQERAVVLRLGKFHAIGEPGLRFYPGLFDSVTKVNVTNERTYSTKGLMLTEDENIVELPLTVQYNIADARNFVLEVRNPVLSLQHATESALRHVVGGSTFDMAISEGRAKISAEVKSRLQTYLDSYQTGINVVEVNLEKGEPPAQVKAAFDDVIEAKEDKDRYVNEAQAYANGIIPEARGQAQRVIEEANAYREKVVAEADGEAQRFEKLLAEYKKAPNVTRERLYLDAVESVMSNSTKVMMGVEGGNSMFYLPLDKIVGNKRSAPAVQDISSDLVDSINRQVKKNLSRSSSVRGEGRR